MDARDVIEFGALLSANSALIIESPSRLETLDVRRSWKGSRDRVARWLRRLHDASESTEAGVVDDILSVAREVIVADLPARCWAAILAARSQRTGNRDLEAVARNILLGRLRVRRYVLQWLLDERRVNESDLADIDRLRRRTERWTDMLTAPLVSRHGLDEFAFDAERSRDFSREEMTDPAAGLWPLMLAGIRVSFEDVPGTPPRAMVENRRFARRVLACLPPDGFELDGPFRSIHHARIRRGSPDLSHRLSQRIG